MGLLVWGKVSGTCDMLKAWLQLPRLGSTSLMVPGVKYELKSKLWIESRTEDGHGVLIV